MNAKLINLIKVAGYEAREYTGRGDRNSCVASSVESATQFQSDLTLAAADGGDLPPGGAPAQRTGPGGGRRAQAAEGA